jgi:hypothetical protein
MDAEYGLLIERLGAAQRDYDSTMTAEERELSQACQCLLCQGMRDMREAIAEWEEARRHTTMLPPPCPDDGEVE